MLYIAQDPTLLGVAAIIASIGGIISTVVGVRKTRRDERDKANEECRQRLKETRAEAEVLAEALHKLRMDQYDGQAKEEVNEVLERWSHLE